MTTTSPFLTSWPLSLDVLGGGAGHVGDRAGPAQHLLDRAGNERRIVDELAGTARGARSAPGCPSADEIAGGLVARDQQQEGELE